MNIEGKTGDGVIYAIVETTEISIQSLEADAQLIRIVDVERGFSGGANIHSSLEDAKKCAATLRETLFWASS